MKLDQLMMGTSLKPSTHKEFEEKRVSKMAKDGLDKAIDKELKQGWVVKSRSHDSEGLHGVILIRKKGQQLPGMRAFTGATSASASAEVLDAIEDEVDQSEALADA